MTKEHSCAIDGREIKIVDTANRAEITPAIVRLVQDNCRTLLAAGITQIQIIPENSPGRTPDIVAVRTEGGELNARNQALANLETGLRQSLDGIVDVGLSNVGPSRRIGGVPQQLTLTPKSAAPTR
jgi:hypothetical protein